MSPFLAACAGTDADEGLTVYAAASLTEAFGEIGRAFEDAHQNTAVTYNFAGSQALATQLSEGARADVFASANEVQMGVAQDAGVIEREPVTFARNQLVIIVPRGNPAAIQTPEDLASPGVKLALGDESVPIGRYAREALAKMSSVDVYGDSFQQRVEDNLVTLESNVKQIAAKVQLGEVDAGVVYQTDAAGEIAEDVQVIPIPAIYNVIASYPVALVEGGNETAGQQFIDLLLSPGGQAILEDYGFAAVTE